MKKISLLMMLAAVVFTACEKEQDMYTVLPIEQVTKPVLAAHENIVVAKSNFSELTTFHWSKADFGVPTATEYSLYVQFGGSTQLISSAFSDSINVKIEDLNNNLNKIEGFPIGVATDVQFYLLASIANTYDKAQSNLITVNVTTLSSLPVSIHLIGAVLGEKSWNNANYEYVMFRDNNLAENTYTAKFKAGGFKFISNNDLGTWNNLYGQIGAGILSQKDAGDITDITVNGYYTVTADISALTYTITPYDASAAPVFSAIGIIGELTNWSSDLDMQQTDYDPHIWILDNATLPAGKLKFRADHAWGTNWGAEGMFPYGKGVNGGADIAIAAEDAGTYFVKFNDLTGHYVFYKK